MKIAGRIIVVTGGASGIGRAMCRRFAAEGAKAVIVADRDHDRATIVAREIGGTTFECDVAREADLIALIEHTRAAHGAIDIFCSNAGIGMAGGVEVPDAEWRRIFDINVMAHVWAARALLPSMLARGEGYFVATASAAGLLTNLGAAPYAVTKHAAVALAEWLAITYAERGIKVSCVCPLGVNTPLLSQSIGTLAGNVVTASGPTIEPDAVADAVAKGIEEERFMILPHPQVAEYFRHKANDYERWLRGMRRLQTSL